MRKPPPSHISAALFSLNALSRSVLRMRLKRPAKREACLHPELEKHAKFVTYSGFLSVVSNTLLVGATAPELKELETGKIAV
jgi:hypothetical protein